MPKTIMPTSEEKSAARVVIEELLEKMDFEQLDASEKLETRVYSEELANIVKNFYQRITPNRIKKL